MVVGVMASRIASPRSEDLVWFKSRSNCKRSLQSMHRSTPEMVVTVLHQPDSVREKKASSRSRRNSFVRANDSVHPDGPLFPILAGLSLEPQGPDEVTEALELRVRDGEVAEERDTAIASDVVVVGGAEEIRDGAGSAARLDGETDRDEPWTIETVEYAGPSHDEAEEGSGRRDLSREDKQGSVQTVRSDSGDRGERR